MCVCVVRAVEVNMAVCTVVLTTDKLLVHWGTGGPSKDGPAENLYRSGRRILSFSGNWAWSVGGGG
jgi:hypothetical protein